MIIVGDLGDPGTTLVLNRLWLNLVDDPSVVMSFRISSFAPGKSVNAVPREAASGRMRLVRSGLAKPRRMQATIVQPTDEQIAWLNLWAGEVVTVRDPDGGKFSGVFDDVGYERPVDGAVGMGLSIADVTSSEVV